MRAIFEAAMNEARRRESQCHNALAKTKRGRIVINANSFYYWDMERAKATYLLNKIQNRINRKPVVVEYTGVAALERIYG
jgi:arabinogalactan endo-1,4-beta-galactosidase